MLVFIIGFMGSGKTTIGQAVAKALEVEFMDMDDLIIKDQGKPISEIFEENGPDYFRALERDLIQSFDDSDADVVIATGGGAPCFYDNMDKMNRIGTTIYLEMDSDALFDRLSKEAAHRPLIANKADVEMKMLIANLLEERRGFYQKATYIVDGDREPHHIVEQILYLLNE